MKKRLRPAQFREYGQWLQMCYGVSGRRVYRILQRSTSVHNYKSRKDEQAALRMRIRDIDQAKVSYVRANTYSLTKGRLESKPQASVPVIQTGRVSDEAEKTQAACLGISADVKDYCQPS